jgi:hypothetical protein
LGIDRSRAAGLINASSTIFSSSNSIYIQPGSREFALLKRSAAFLVIGKASVSATKLVEHMARVNVSPGTTGPRILTWQGSDHSAGTIADIATLSVITGEATVRALQFDQFSLPSYPPTNAATVIYALE